MDLNPAIARVNSLVDRDSFQQFLAGVEQHIADVPRKPGDGVLTGFAKVDGRNVAIFAHDPSFAGGSLGEVGVRKISQLFNSASRFGVPVIGFIDSSGARLQEGARSLLAVGEMVKSVYAASGRIPIISVIFGGGVGGAAFLAALGDIVIGVGKSGYMFLHGPRAVKHATGQEVSVMELGSVNSLAKTSGLIHFVIEDEDGAISLVKKILSYLPSNHLQTPPYSVMANNVEDEQREVNESSEIRSLINSCVDTGTFLELYEKYALNVVTGLGRLNGLVVGLAANEPKYLNGYIDLKACIKLSKFIEFCDRFNIPIITIVDTPGFEPGVVSEHNGIIREGTKIFRAYLNATVPKITVLAGKGYGGGFIAMCSKGIGADYVVSLPSAEVAVQPIEISVEILYRKELEKLSGEERVKMFSQYIEKLRKSSRAEALLSIGVADEIVEQERLKTVLTNIVKRLYDEYVKNVLERGKRL